MNIRMINAGGSPLPDGKRNSNAVNAGGIPSNENKTGKFDSFTMTGIKQEKAGQARKAPDGKQAELIHRLSDMSGEEQALAAIDAYSGLKREMVGRARNYEAMLNDYSEMQREYDFCKSTLENDGIAVCSGKFSFGTAEEGRSFNKEVLTANMKRLDRSLSIMASSFDRSAARPDPTGMNKRMEEKQAEKLAQLADIYNAATGGTAGGFDKETAFSEGGCFDRYIDGITRENFVSRVSEKIGQLNSYTEDLSRSFSAYLDSNKTAEELFRKYPRILEMRREFGDLREMIGKYDRQLRDSLGINDILEELERIREENDDEKELQ